ncbi:MAG TPA: hypothetical protein VFI42_00985 [Thermomicrobiaceae bacterium]|nr:hypothetical protein [Thermomicrobiaceae bacterium]
MQAPLLTRIVGRATPVLVTVLAVLVIILGILVIIYPVLLTWIVGIGLILLGVALLASLYTPRS